jgi:hypothetical protein
MMINIILFHLFISFTTGQTSNKDLCLIVSINIVKDECLKSVYENVPWGIALFITVFFYLIEQKNCKHKKFEKNRLVNFTKYRCWVNCYNMMQY